MNKLNTWQTSMVLFIRPKMVHGCIVAVGPAVQATSVSIDKSNKTKLIRKIQKQNEQTWRIIHRNTTTKMQTWEPEASALGRKPRNNIKKNKR